jgi:hypothetical protein
MRQLVDLTGKRFGKLVVIERGENTGSGQPRWYCKCDCGELALVQAYNLKYNRTKSCGCDKLQPKEDLTNKKFGRWLAMKYVGNKRWKCICECGNENEIPTQQLKNGSSKSCGCYSDEVKNTKKKTNIYKKIDDYIIGIDETGKEFYFDLEDEDKILSLDCYWRIEEVGGYVTSNRHHRRFKMHDVIMNPTDGYVVDHINGKPHDNRKNNLRICTQDKNSFNKKLYSNNKTGYKGVYFDKKSNKWMASIGVNNKSIYLGRFNTKEEAVEVRLKAEEEYFGEFRRDDEFL